MPSRRTDRHRANIKLDRSGFLAGPSFRQSGGIVALLWRIRIALFGTLPDVRPWHPRWPDYRLLLETLQKLLAEHHSTTSSFSNTPHVYARWLARAPTHALSIESSRLLNLSRAQYMPLIGSFDACLLVLTEGDLKRGNEFLERSGPLLKQDGQVFVFTTNYRIDDFAGFGPSIAYNAAYFSNLKLWLSETKFVRASKLRWNYGKRLCGLHVPWPVVRYFIFLSQQLPEDFSRWRPIHESSCAARKIQPRRGGCSSVFMVMRPSANLPLPRFEGEDLTLSRPIMSNAEHPPTAARNQAEPRMSLG